MIIIILFQKTVTILTCSSSCIVAAKGKPSDILAIIVNNTIMLCNLQNLKENFPFNILAQISFVISALFPHPNHMYYWEMWWH